MFYSSLHQVWQLLFVLFMMVFVASGHREELPQTGTDWQAPVLFYENPDTADVQTFGADVFESTISVVQQQFDTTGGAINYSNVFLTQQPAGSELQRCLVSDDAYPAEQPFMLRTSSGRLNIFWGERRVDPGLEQWNIPIPMVMATSLFHAELQSCAGLEPKEIYEGALSTMTPGGGELRLPVSATTGAGEQLHLAYGAEGEFGELSAERRTGVVVLSRDDVGVWHEPAFTLLLRFNQTITGAGTNRLVLPHLGAPPLLPGGNANEVYIITSDNGGNTWSEPNGIFTQANQLHDGGIVSNVQAQMLPNGQVHLMFRQNRDSGYSVFANIMWHTVSDDYGRTWLSPTNFFGVQRPDEEHYHFIRSADMVADHSGRVHWVGVTHLGGAEGIEQSELHYKIWSPETRRWEQTDIIPIDGHPGSIYFSIDKPGNKLYLFWEEETGESFGKREAIYYTFRDLGEANQLPVISEAGPLKLHANFPNPFASETTIPFTLEEPGRVTLNVYDTGGRRIFQRDLGMVQAGFHQEHITSEMLSSGMYIYEFIVNGTYRQKEKMMVIK